MINRGRVGRPVIDLGRSSDPIPTKSMARRRRRREAAVRRTGGGK